MKLNADVRILKIAKQTNDFYVNLELRQYARYGILIKVTWKQKLEFSLKMNNISYQNKTEVLS